jgi:hypothetical protein
MSPEENLITEFTREFLEEFYGTTKYFNVDEIAKDATPKIIARKNDFKRYYDYYNEAVTKYEANLDAVDFDDDTIDVLNILEGLFVQDLFMVTYRPIRWAYHLCKGETPDNDCFDGSESALNYKYNRKIMQWLSDEIDASTE